MAIDDAAERLGLDGDEPARRHEILRYSTTLAMNKLIERKGPRLGLIMTEGFEDTVLIGRASQWSDGIPFKEQRNIAGADKPRAADPAGPDRGRARSASTTAARCVRPLDEDHFLAQLDRLVDVGCPRVRRVAAVVVHEPDARAADPAS